MPKLSEVLDSDPSCDMGHIDRYSKVKPNSKPNKKKFRPRFDIQSVDRFNSSRRAICSTKKIYDDDSLSSKSEIWESLWRQNDKHLERQGNNSRSRSVGRVQISYVSGELDRRSKRRHQHDQSTNNRKFPESKHGSLVKSPNANNSSCCCCYVNPPLLRCPPADMNCDEFVLTPCQIDVLLSLAATHASNTAMVDNCKFALLSCDYHTIINNYIIAAKFDLYDVTERLMDQIRANFVCVARTKEFLSLPLDVVMMFLQDNNLNVEDELEIFFAALNWVDFNKMQRLPDAGKVLNCVRYVYINPSDILQYVEPNLHMFTGPHGTEAMLNMYRYRALILSGTIPAPPNVTPFCQPPAMFLQEVDPQASNLVAPIPPPRSLPPDPNIPPSQFAMFPPQGFMGPCEPPPLPPRSWSPGPNFQQVNTVTMYSPQDTPIVRPQSPLETTNVPSNLPFSCLPVGYIPPPMFVPGQVPEGMYNSRLTMRGPLSPAAGTPQPPSKSPSAASQAKQPSPESKAKGAAEKSKSASETKLKDKEPSKTSSKTDEGKDGKKDKAERSKDDKKDKSEKKQDSSKSAPEPQTMKEILTKLKSEKKDINKKGKEKSSSKSKKKEAEDEEDDSTEDNDDKDKEEKSKKSKNKQSPTSKSSSKEKSSKKTKGNKEDKKDDSEKGKKSSKKKKRDDDDDDDDEDDDEDDEKEDEEKVNKSKSQSKTKAQSKAASKEPGKDKQREADSEDNEDDEKKPKTKSGTKSKSQKEDKKQESGGKSANDSPEVKKGSSKSASKEDKIKKGSNPDDDKKSKNKDDKKSESSRSKKEKKERRDEKKSDEEDKEGRRSKRNKSGEKKERRDEKKSSEEDKEGRRSKRDKSGEKKERHKSRSKTKDKNDSPSSQTDDDDQKSSPKRRRHKSRRSKSQSSESPDSGSKKRSKQKSTRSESRGSRRGTMFLGHMKR